MTQRMRGHAHTHDGNALIILPSSHFCFCSSFILLALSSSGARQPAYLKHYSLPIKAPRSSSSSTPHITAHHGESTSSACTAGWLQRLLHDTKKSSSAKHSRQLFSCLQFFPARFGSRLCAQDCPGLHGQVLSPATSYGV